eukprot:2917039-Rhodomonas_salina.1
MFNKGKHIDVRVYYLREVVQDWIMELFHVSTHDQVADVFTKLLPSEVLKKHCVVLSGADDITIRAPESSVFGKARSAVWDMPPVEALKKLKVRVVASGADYYDGMARESQD